MLFVEMQNNIYSSVRTHYYILTTDKIIITRKSLFTACSTTVIEIVTTKIITALLKITISSTTIFIFRITARGICWRPTTRSFLRTAFLAIYTLTSPTTSSTNSTQDWGSIPTATSFIYTCVVTPISTPTAVVFL